jgi:hypothetical protein
MAWEMTGHFLSRNILTPQFRGPAVILCLEIVAPRIFAGVIYSVSRNKNSDCQMLLE